MNSTVTQEQVTLAMATAEDREVIYAMRHEVYACELGQHPVNAQQRLTDPLDAFNHYIVARQEGRIVGFVSITPPGGGKYSIDKYFKRQELPFPIDDRLYEIRLLTVPESSRQRLLASALMYAAFRWAEARGGDHVMAIGRQEIRNIHLRIGMKPTGQDIKSGAVTYGLLHATMSDIHSALPGVRHIIDRALAEMRWDIGVAPRTPGGCYHGGKFFEAVGEEFDHLERLDSVISADVLDAWYDPSPKTVEAIKVRLPQILKTSPPTGCQGLVRAIARARGVPATSILPGSGSSDLIFLALNHWLRPNSRVLILDPSYGEYAHVLESVVGCQVERLSLNRAEGYQLDLKALAQRLALAFDLVILVNPNNPTGRHVERGALESVLRQAPGTTRVLVDETYVEYAGPDQSLEKFAAASENIIVCKSMSKTYALSGARVAYLCAGRHQLESMRPLTPPWAVSLPAQIAAVHALDDSAYYAMNHAETHRLRARLADSLAVLGWDVVPSVTNFLLCHLPENGQDADALLTRCREHCLFLRNAASMGTSLGKRTVRIAVKDAETNQRMVEILRAVCQ